MSSDLNFHISEIEAVSILNIQGGGFKLKEGVIKSVFKCVEDVPVAIISVAGALREGKSFMLNMLLQYLSKQKAPQHSTGKDGKALNIFKSRNGTKRETIGINITNKPFMLRDKNNQEVAVFLMDSEGLFDKGRDAKQCSTVFAMSCLLSSVQIYNVLRQVHESQLQHLQIFSNYAMATGKTKRKSDTTSAPFQGLLFLVRDWTNKDYDCNAKGGEKYLEDLLKSDTAENMHVRGQIINSFTEIRCHLLPKPGEEVESRDGDEISISDIKEKFLHGIEALGEQLFKPENVTAKTLNGVTVTGNGFLQLAVTYANILHTGKMPEAATILKANQHLYVVNRTRQLESEYHKAMKEMIGEKYILPGILEELHKECVEHASQQFNEMIENTGPEETEVLESNRTDMLKNLELAFYAIIHRNNAKKTAQKKAIKACAADAGNCYKEILIEAANEKYIEDVSSHSQLAEERALAVFSECTQAYDKELAEQYKFLCDDAISSMHSEFLKQNSDKGKILEFELISLFDAAVRNYEKMMEKGIEEPGPNADFTKLREKAINDSVRMFEQSDVGEGYKSRQTKLKELKPKLAESDEKYEYRFEEYKDKDLLKVVKKAKISYKDYVAEFRHDTYLEEDEMAHRHQRATDVAMKALKKLKHHGDGALVEKGMKDIISELNDQQNLMKKENRILQQKANAEFKKRRGVLVEKHFKDLFEENKTRYVENGELQNKLKELENVAVEAYDTLRSPPEREFQSNKLKLKRDIQNQKDKITEQNKKNKERIEEQIEEFNELLMADYTELLNETTSNRYAKRENLRKFHNKFKDLVKQEMIKAIPYTDIQQDAIAKCSDGLEIVWKDLVQESTKWKSFKGNVMGGASIGANIGTGLMGVVGGGIAGLAGGILGGIAGLAKNVMQFKFNILIDQLPSIRHLNSLNLAKDM